ncbi:MAG: PF20097 family protein [Verrucomicrobiota bacterium]
MSEDPYSPPETPEETKSLTDFECPSCGSIMKPGKVNGSLNWVSPDSPPLERFLGGKRVVGTPSFTLTLTNQSTPALCCETCGLLVIQPKD